MSAAFDASTWSPLPAREPVTVDAERALAELLAWAADGGAAFDPVEIRTSPGGYRRGYARRAIAAGELIVVVPRRLLITDVDALQAERVEPLGSFGGFLSSRHSRLAVWLALEIGDRTSSWRPYLAALPPAFPQLPAYRSGRELAALTGTRALSAVIAQVAGVRDDLELIHGEVADLADLSLAEFAWGRSVLASRCFGMDDADGSARALVPLVDLFDHGPVPATWIYNRDNRAFEIRASRDLPAGHEIHVSYGPHENAWFLSRHGFAIPDNPDDEIVLHLATPAGPREVTVGAKPDRRFDRALALAHAWPDTSRPAALARIAAAAAAAGAVLMAAPDVPSDDPDWRSLCRIVRAGEQAVIAAIVAFTEDGLATAGG